MRVGEVWAALGVLGRVVVLTLVAVLLVAVAPHSHAVEPGWYSPDDESGQGIIVRCGSAGCAVSWLTYRDVLLSRLHPGIAELITVVQESTAVQEAPRKSEIIAMLDEVLDTRVSTQLWLVSTQNCAQGEPCVTSLADTAGRWFGDDFVLRPETVFVELIQDGDTLTVDWDSRALFPDRCLDTGTGGVIFNKCVGTEQFRLIAR